MTKPINVGISVFTAQGADIWSSGINQNLAFMVLLLRCIPQVQGIYLLNGGSGEELPAGMASVLPGIPLVRPEHVTHRVDVVIEMGAQLPLEWMRHVRALGARTILFLAGHSFASAAENPVFGRTAGMTFTGTTWDQVWMLPHHVHSSAAMVRTLTRARVEQMPHLWSPAFLDRAIDVQAGEGRAFGFERGRRARRAGWRAGIFEPNISVVKSCILPMLACEEAYRRDRDAVELMMVMNSLHMKEHPSFNSLAAGLDLSRDSRATYEPRVPFVECMSRFALDAVVSHHWECGLNYLYYDALYGGYPLVHNSEFLQQESVGIYYPGFDASAAATALLEARDRNPGFWVDYARAGRAFLRTLAPEHPRNIEDFVRRLFA